MSSLYNGIKEVILKYEEEEVVDPQCKTGMQLKEYCDKSVCMENCFYGKMSVKCNLFSTVCPIEIVGTIPCLWEDEEIIFADRMLKDREEEFE